MTVTMVGIVGLIVFSPLALEVLDGNGRDWERLSLIGQSYGGISAVLAAAAVVGVALTLILQQRQIREARRLAIRQFHQHRAHEFEVARCGPPRTMAGR